MKYEFNSFFYNTCVSHVHFRKITASMVGFSGSFVSVVTKIATSTFQYHETVTLSVEFHYTVL
jgi:hypothetical protein